MSVLSLEEVTKLVHGQDHLVQFYEDLTDEDKVKFVDQLKTIDFEDGPSWFKDSEHPDVPKPENLLPMSENRHIRSSELSKDVMDQYWKAGIDAIFNGEVCAVVLAGGQASRLGSSEPKGTIPLGINAAHSDSLLGIQAAKIALLQSMAGKHNNATSKPIHWAIMTSPGTDAATRKHVDQLIEHYQFSPDQVTIFQQKEIAAYDEDGLFMLSTKSSVVTAPNGNGGFYSAFAPHLTVLRNKGYKYFHVYCVDNILCKVADPHFIGFSAVNDADCATKCVQKEKGELVGSVCLDNDTPRVVEYSELSREQAEQMTADGKYVFGAGTIANHLFNVDFLSRLCSPTFKLPYHRASKKIAFINKDGQLVKPTEPNGVKLEQFIFDVFQFSKNFFIWEVKRDEEFSPLKNAESAGTSCLSTCRKDLAELNKKWIEKAGGKVVSNEPVYLQTLESYDGENLEILKGLEITPKCIENYKKIGSLFTY